MKVRSHVTYLIAGALSFLAVGTATAAPPPAARADANMAQITVLYDAFGKTSTMKKDWGFSAFIEYGGKRILLDTGNNAEILAHNAKARGIDLTKLDFVVVTHRHGDHTSGLNYLMSVNPKVKIYAPKRTSACSAQPCREPSTGATKPCRPKCATLTANRPTRCASARRGRTATSSG